MGISRLWNAVAASTGALFGITLVFGVMASLSPYADIDPTSTSADIATALSDGADSLATGNFVLLVSAFLLVVFSSYLRHVVTPEDVTAWPATVGLSGGVLAAALLTVVALIGISQGQIDDYGADTAAAKALLLLSWGSFTMMVPGLAALAGGMSLMSLSYATLPRWVGWIGVAATLLLMTFWTLGILVVMAWMASASVLLVMSEVRAEATTEDAPPDA